MGNYTDAMQKLTAEINSTTERRRAALTELRSDANNLIARFDQEHQDRAQGLRKRAHAIKREMGEISSDLRQAGRIWREGTKKKERMRRS